MPLVSHRGYILLFKSWRLMPVAFSTARIRSGGMPVVAQYWTVWYETLSLDPLLRTRAASVTPIDSTHFVNFADFIGAFFHKGFLYASIYEGGYITN